MPAPHGPETVKESNVLEQVRVQPETRRHSEYGDTEEDQTEDGHGKEETQQSHHADTQVPHALAQNHRPQREQHHGEDTSHDGRRHGLLLPLRTLVEPDVMHHSIGVLVLLDLHGPQTLDAVLGFGVVVSLVRVVLCDAKCE